MHQVYAADSIDVTTKWSGPVNGSIVTRETTDVTHVFQHAKAVPRNGASARFGRLNTRRLPVRR